MRYEYQIDYGNGYEEAFPNEPHDAAAGGAENPSAWLNRIEAEGRSYRARVLLNGETIEERHFACTVAQSRTEPSGRTQYRVQCPGGQVTVNEQPDGKLSGHVHSGYIGDADIAVAKACEVVRRLKQH